MKHPLPYAFARENLWLLEEEDGRLTDAPNDAVVLAGPPVLPEGAELSRIDVVIRLRRT